jgi:hypothetical protein
MYGYMYVYELKHAAVKPYNIQKRSDNTNLTPVEEVLFLIDPIPD